MISIHLSDEEITGAAAGERLPRIAHHLQICAECQLSVEAYRDRLATLRQDICYSAGRSAIEWGRQSRAIQQGILAARIDKTQGRNTGFALVSATFALALLVIVFLGFRDTPRPAPHSGPPISDAALLNDIEARMNEDFPEALQPASLLVDEMDGSRRAATTHNSHASMRNAQ